MCKKGGKGGQMCYSVGFASSVKNHHFVSPPWAHFNTLARDTNTNETKQTKHRKPQKGKVANRTERRACCICSFFGAGLTLKWYAWWERSRSSSGELWPHVQLTYFSCHKLHKSSDHHSISKWVWRLTQRWNECMKARNSLLYFNVILSHFVIVFTAKRFTF